MTNWESIHKEAVAHLQTLLKFDTSNPPGNESEAISWLAKILQENGLHSTIIESAPGRANLVCRLSADSKNNSGGLILSSHVDVVPADATMWQHPPFGGVIAGGYVWGRGAIDMKSMTIYNLMTILQAKRENWPLSRDLIFVALADEERGARLGSDYLVTNHPELLTAEYALNEVGGFTLHVGGSKLYPVEVAQKGIVSVKVTVRGKSGHGSMPKSDMVTEKISKAALKLAKNRLPFHLTESARDFIKEISKCSTGISKILLSALTSKIFGKFAVKLLPNNSSTDYLKAILRNTAAPNSILAGNPSALNVIPGFAELYVDGRILPGQSEQSFLLELKNSLGTEFEFEVLQSIPATEQKRDTPLWNAISKVVEEQDPSAKIIPYLMSGFDDAHFYKKLGITTYGFQPIKIDPDFQIMSMYHADNERIPLDGFCWGVRTMSRLVQEFSSK